MKQHADNLANRLLIEFQNIENLSIDKLEKLAKKIEVSNILVQELQSHVTRYKLISTEKEQITYFKYCLPMLKKWSFAYQFLHQVEKEALLGTTDIKMNYYTSAFRKLNCSYKTKEKEFSLIRQCDKNYESQTLITSNLNNDIIALYEAHFIAEKYLVNIIDSLKNFSIQNTTQLNSIQNLKWNKSKTDLVELSYSLYYGNCITDLSTQKPIQLNTLIKLLENLVSVDLKDFKRLFSDVKKRNSKEAFTKFLNQTIQHQIEIHFK